MARSKGIDGAAVLVLVNLGDDVTPNWTPVAEQTNLSTESTRNLIEASSKDSDHTKWIYGKQDDTVSLEALYVPNDAAFKALEDAMKNKESVVLRRTENGTDIEEATALVSTISKEWPDNDASTVSVEFQLDEPWTPITP
ncbi:phage tail tube protein [Anoxybacillus sp. FSL W8-1294]